MPLNYQTPFLTYARDFPALALGYRLPAYRLAIEVSSSEITSNLFGSKIQRWPGTLS